MSRTIGARPGKRATGSGVREAVKSIGGEENEPTLRVPRKAAGICELEPAPEELSRIEPELRRMLMTALAHAGLQSEPTNGSKQPTSSSRASATSRQAHHARLARIRSSIVAATACMCEHDAAYIDAFLHPDFVWFRPMCADAYTKTAYLAQLREIADPSRYELLFDRCYQLLSQLAPNLEHADRKTALHAYSALAGMYFTTYLFGAAFATRWKAAFDAAERSPMLRNPMLQVHLATMGSFVGHCDAHVELLFSGALTELQIADMYCFVRRDTSEQLYEVQADLMRGQQLNPVDCLYPRRPRSTLFRLADFALACMRDQRHFGNSGQILMVLKWIEALRTHPSSSLGRRPGGDEARRWNDLLIKIERVQQFEKSRFFRAVDTLADGDVKMRMLSLWFESSKHSRAIAAEPTYSEG